MNNNIETLLNQELDQALLGQIEAEDAKRQAEHLVEAKRAEALAYNDTAVRVRKGLNALTGKEVSNGEVNSQLAKRRTELRRQA